MERKVARILVTTDLIAQLLHLPRTAKIVQMDGERVYEGIVKLLIEDESLNPVRDGELIPQVDPTVKYVFNWNQKANGA